MAKRVASLSYRIGASREGEIVRFIGNEPQIDSEEIGCKLIRAKERRMWLRRSKSCAIAM